jgi:hypothetical protein
MLFVSIQAPMIILTVFALSGCGTAEGFAGQATSTVASVSTATAPATATATAVETQTPSVQVNVSVSVPQSTDSGTAVDSQPAVILVVADESRLPTCDRETEGETIYVQRPGAYVECEYGVWIDTYGPEGGNAR